MLRQHNPRSSASSWIFLSLALVLVLPGACGPSGEDATSEPEVAAAVADLPYADDVQQRVEQFAPTEIQADMSPLSESDRAVVATLVQASDLMAEIFWRQAWRGNPEMRERLQSWSGPGPEAARSYFEIMMGPWDRQAEREPFIGSEEHPPGAGFYPEDLTAEEFEAWLTEHPDQRAGFESLNSVVRRTEDGGLRAVPYSEEYAEWLQPAAELLRQAASQTDDPTLRRFLELRADAFLSDDYYESDLAWMDLDGLVEVTIGPYEVYEDELFNFKAAFTSYVTVALPGESAKLDAYKARLPWLEQNLPIPEQHKNLDRGSESPLRVVDVVYAHGDARPGVQALAYNLPNDERVREAKGSKKVLLRNVIRAKYDQMLMPIAQRTLSAEDAANVSFEAFFNQVLHHELSHGLGPGLIEVDGRETEVRLELKEFYSVMEEAKADVMGIYNILSLIGTGDMSEDLAPYVEPTYVAGLFRSARFGYDEAHGQGVVAQFNYLLEKGALTVDEEGRFATVSGAFPGAIRDLLHRLVMLQATGDYAATKDFLERYGRPSPELVAAIERLRDVPVDLKPIYPQASGR